MKSFSNTVSTVKNLKTLQIIYSTHACCKYFAAVFHSFLLCLACSVFMCQLEKKKKKVS